MAKELRYSTLSLQGRRQQNQDSVLAERFPDDGLLLAVADGMGGHAAGEVASALAIETLLKAIRAGEGLEDGVRLANWQVHKKAQDPHRQGMGTTLTVMYLKDDRYRLANVGDSRAYRLSRRGIRQLTEDHSFVFEAMKRGQPEAVALDSPWKDALTRSIGTDEEVEVDVFGPFPVEDDTAVLLCSDGLYKTLERGEIWKIFMASADLHEAAQELATTAFERGSDDNITVAIAEFGAFPRRQAGSGPRPRGWSAAEERRGREDFRPILEEEVEVIGWGEEVGETAGVEENAAKKSSAGGTGAVDRGENRTGTDRPAEGGIGGRNPMKAEMAANAHELGLTGRRRAVAPWELNASGQPKIVGGPKPTRRVARSLLFVSTVVVVVALAALLYFG